MSLNSRRVRSVLKNMRKNKLIKDYKYNFQNFFSPLYRYPIRDEMIGITTNHKDIMLVIKLSSDKNYIYKMKFFYYFKEFGYFQHSYTGVNSGIVVLNSSAVLTVDCTRYATIEKFQKLILDLTSKHYITKEMRLNEWTKMKECSGEEYYDLLYRVEHPTLKKRK